VSSYQYLQCDNYLFLIAQGKEICLYSSYTSVDVVPIVPAFTYSNLCGSVILTSYIPVYIYLYIMSIVINIASTYIYCNYVNYSTIPEIIQNQLMGVMWTAHDWSNAISPESLSRKLLKVDNVICDILHHICILLTFGLCCPVLAIAIAMYISIYVFVLLAILGRFSHRLNNDVNVTYVWIAFELASRDTNVYITNCMWEVVFMSSVFYALLCWDMASDRTYWKDAMWIPGTAVVLPFAMWSINYIFQRLQVSRGNTYSAWYQNIQNVTEANRDIELIKHSCGNIPNRKMHDTGIVVSPLAMSDLSSCK
jgi:hypothetical protein